MTDLPLIASLADAIALPLLGLAALLAIKLTIGETLQQARRYFLLALVIISLVTLRTVSRLDDVCLIHMLTLAMMVVGSCMVPARENVANLEHS